MGEIEPVTLDLPEEWSWESEFRIIRERPKRGYNTVMRVAEMEGHSEHGFSNPYYVIKEAYLGEELVAKAQTKEQARKKMMEAAIDHY
jgi:hypothetical protein